jgi:soluble lytic murein transglycosylase-like protein
VATPDPLAPYDPVFQAAGQEWNVDPLLLRSIAMQESGGNARAVSVAGAQGLMQIMPKTQRYLGVTDPFEPVQSIYGAAKYMAEALDKEGSPDRALLYYHGGPGWRQSYARDKESQDYVPAVAGHYQRFLKAAQPAAPAIPPAMPQQAVAVPTAPQEPR